MQRRNFLLSTGALLLAPFAAEAQQAAKVWRIGVLRPGPDDAVFRENIDPFWQALRERGFTEGKNLAIDYRVRPAKPEEMLVLANELVRVRVDAILAISPSAVRAAAKATASIPIVANDLESDPVAEKFAANLGRPGGNVTGVFLDFPEMGGKWIQLLQEAVPKLARVAVLWDPGIGPYLLKGVEAAASSMRVQVLPLEARSPGDFAGAFQTAAKHKAQALLVLSAPAFNSARKEIAELAIKRRLPAIMPFPNFADAGGLMAYGPHLTSLFRQCGGVMAKILQGAQPAEIAIERPTRFEFALNTKTAKALGIIIPQSLRVRADRVIE
jgi:putative ABC transport system substrate-binding protein